MTSESELTKGLHLLLSNPNNAPDLREILSQLDARVHEVESCEDKEKAQQDFEEELQVIYDKEVDHSHIQQLEIFLAALSQCRKILSPASIISTWFDLLLRPALREPRLSSTAIEHAKQLVLLALQGEESEKVQSFRRRLLDLFLLDVLNESSEKDIFEWAELDEAQREKNSWWKNNLEDVLVRYGLQEPIKFMSVMNDCFQIASSRLQVLTLLDTFIAQPSIVELSPSVMSHPLFSSLLVSLEVDNSSTVCAVELACLVKVLPVVAVKSFSTLKDTLPCLLGILGRVLCWKSRNGRLQQVSKVAYSDLLEYSDDAVLAEAQRKEEQDTIEIVENRQLKLKLRDEFNWERLEWTFDLSTSSLPVPRQYFSILYYLFPCNVVHFLRHPIKYLTEANLESPFTVSWEKALDDLEIRTAGSLLLRSFVMHPSVLVHDVQTELADSKRWATSDVAQIVGESMMLDVSMSTQSLREAETPGWFSSTPKNSTLHRVRDGYTTTVQTPTIRAHDLEAQTPRQRKVSLREIIATSVALKSGAEINVSDNAPSWPSILFTPPPSSPLARASSSPNLFEAGPSSISPSNTEVKLPSQISETISGLQREVLLLRTELNFELWMKRETVRHISHLRKEDVVMKGAEAEQQRLQDKLREYRAQLFEARKQYHKHQAQAEAAKKQSNEWFESLQNKLVDLREQKKHWEADTKSLNTEISNLKSDLAAQSKLLSEATSRESELKTAIKKDAHKVARLRDYEKRIEQLTAMHRMWNKDIVLYNEQSKEMSQLVSEYQKMKLRAEASEKAQQEVESEANANRRRIQALEASLRSMRMGADQQKHTVSEISFSQKAESERLAAANKRLREENAELRDEIEEVKAMVQILREQSLGTKGLVSATQTSLIL